MRTRPSVSVAVLVPCLALVALVTSGASCGGDDDGGAPGADTDSGAGNGDSGNGGGGDSGGNGGNGDSGGGGDSGLTCDPVTSGDPVTAPANAWTWIDVPDAKCRDGSPSGMGVRLKPGSKKLYIYMQGGGACFNNLTCGTNPTKFGSGDFDGWKGTQGEMGIMSDANAANPVKDWNAVFLPYCSGDIFGGSVESANVPAGPQGQRFTGVSNMLAYLKRIVPTFSAVDQVLLTGSSAGGFGAAISYERVAKAFCPRPVVMIDDAGPVMSDTYLAPCLQKRFRDAWNLNAGLPAGCPNCENAQHGGLVNAVPYEINKYPQSRFGLISADQDSTIRLFMSFGGDTCKNLDTGFPASYDGPTFSKGLAELRDTYLKPTGTTSTYFVPGETHTFLGGDAFYTTTVQNVTLPNWVAGLLSGAAPTHIGP